MKKIICCICGKPVKGYGNNPYGHLDDEGNPIEYEPWMRCCDECNASKVIPGRMKIMAKENAKKGLD